MAKDKRMIAIGYAILAAVFFGAALVILKGAGRKSGRRQ